MTTAPSRALADDYLELLKRALLHTLYAELDLGHHRGRNVVSRALFGALRRRGVRAIRTRPNAEQFRAEGRDWPVFAQTMIGRARLDHLQEAVDRVLDEGVPGDLIETGVWRGGASILMRGVLRARDVTDRRVYVADSFAGLPRPDPARYPADAGAGWHEAAETAVSREEVEANFRRYGLLDDQVVFLVGWFRDTLPPLAGHRWAVVRLDGDMYESTMDGLVHLYEGLSPGGFCIVDDFSVDACRAAVEDFRAQAGIEEPIEEIDWTGVYWRKRA